MSCLLAIDQASLTSGWSVWIDKQLVKYGHFTAPSTGTLGHRLNYIRAQVKKLIDEYNIDQVAFEDIQLQANKMNNVHTYRVLAEVIGAIESLCDELKLPYEIISSNTWKSTLGIKGAKRQDQKRNAQLHVNETYNIKATQDECDAICIGEHVIFHSVENLSFDWS